MSLVVGPRELLNNIKVYQLPKLYPLQTIWPPLRRSAVMIILFVGNYGELRVLLTKRSRQLNNFSGHVSLPGGKADNEHETDWDMARRECFEEIGLPYDEELKRQGLILEKLNSLPCYLSRTFLSVRPMVCFLKDQNDDLAPVNDLKLMMNPGETSSVFSIPLLDLIDKNMKKEYLKKSLHTVRWGGLNWPLKHYYYSTSTEDEVHWLQSIVDLSSDEELEEMLKHEKKDIKDVWGLTAQILYDLAHITTGEKPNDVGNENLIYALTEFGGVMTKQTRSKWEIGMIKGNTSNSYSEVLPRHIYSRIIGEYKI